MNIKNKQARRRMRHRRIRGKIYGTPSRPRLCVFRSAKHIYAQLVDDEKAKTLLSANDKELVQKKKKTKIEKSREVGKLIAQKALKKNIEKVVFDRGGYKYHGRVKALAEGAREGGLKF